ncbi:MAG: rod shape-determining protein RodA [Desulfovibrionales bacterium]
MILIDRRFFSHINWTLVGLLLVLFGLGILNLYSASALRMETGLSLTPYYKRQLIWGVMGLGFLLGAMSIDYRHLKVVAVPLYVLTVILLLSVPLFGKTIYGARRWLDLGFMNLQPSELAKISVLVITARLLAKVPDRLTWKPFLKICGVAAVPASLIVIQPDLGTGMNILLLVGGMVLFKGLSGNVLKPLLVLIPALLPFGWFLLHDYQKQRIMTFLNPGGDPLGAGYHIIQSQIAIGSGEFWGKGFLEGTQSQLRFLPEKHTDFALAVFGEEWGFVGCILLLGIFCAYLYQITMVALESKDDFGSCLAAGVFFYFFWQVLINMGMVLGLMPVVGIPLPFVSYGGSSLIVNFCLIGIVLNVSMRRFFFKQD